MFKKILNRQKEKLTEDERIKGAKRRAEIINNAEAMKRLIKNSDFQILCKLLEDDKQGLIETLLNEDMHRIIPQEQNIRLKARIFQINSVLKKSNSIIWQMENLTEVREAIKEQTRVRQAHGTKTGGESE